MLKSLALAFALLVAAPAAFADAIPMPATLTDDQRLLMGVWQEDGWARPKWGHASLIRTIAVGNDRLVVLTLGGIVISNDYDPQATKGKWVATRLDTKTIKLTLDQGGGHATDLTLVFDGPDGFTLTDPETNAVEPSHFHRVPDTQPAAKTP